MPIHRLFVARFASVFLALFAVGCARQFSAVPGVQSAANSDVRQAMPSNAKFALRVPHGAGPVTAVGAGGLWAKFEQGLFAAGLEMVDQALLQELLASNPSPSYEQIRARTGADVLIDIGEANLEFRRLDPADAPYELYCELITVSAKLVDVARGTMLGTLNLTSSSCPAASYARTDDYGRIASATRRQLWWCGEGSSADHYAECPAPTARYAVSAIYLEQGEPRRWVAAGKEFAQAVRARMTGAPVDAASISAALPPPAAATVVAPPPTSPPPAAATVTTQPTSVETTAAPQSLEGRLAKLREMLKQGVITQAEHDAMRKKVLADY